MDNPDSVLVYAAGDIYSDRTDPASIYSIVADVLGRADVAFCQLESPLAHTTVPTAANAAKAHDAKQVASAIKDAGFNVVSFASNHCMEDGMESFLETLDTLKSAGCNPIGCGRDEAEARKPAIFECKGNRIAFLAYNSVGTPESWVQKNKPGCVPLRARALYEPMEPTQTGTPVRIHTFPYREDVASMIIDIEKAKSQADVVVVSQHSGVHITSAVVAEYQVDIAHAAIDAGADLILQHHAHILKGIEVYHGKTICYGLGNFALEVHFMSKEWANQPMIKELRKALDPNWEPPYPEYPSYPFPPDARKTILVKFLVANGSVSRVSFLPAIINGQSQPEIVPPTDERFQQVIDYVVSISEKAGFHPKFKIDGEEVLILG
ncbi:MAG TPA: CapA family protein [Syntrophorhabdaceae bacterium]|nr:CapA family protein [Syntrophorhabdaceae bacterium]